MVIAIAVVLYILSPMVLILFAELLSMEIFGLLMMFLINTANSGGINFNGFLTSDSNQNLTVQKETIITEEIDTIEIACTPTGHLIH